MFNGNLQPRGFQSLNAFHELRVLKIRIAFIYHIRCGKMGEGACHFNALQGFYFFSKHSRFFNFHTNPVHARIQGNMDPGFFTPPQPCFIQQVQTFLIKHRMGDVKPHTKVGHRRADRHGPQHKDRFGDARFPQLHSFLHQCHRKIIHAGLHAGYGHRNRAVAIGVGLHYHAQLCTRFQIFPCGFNIIRYGVQIHDRPCSPVRLHEYSPPVLKKLVVLNSSIIAHFSALYETIW